MTPMLPCPFCGERAISTHAIRDGRECRCGHCGAGVCAFNPDADAKARQKWNARAQALEVALPSDHPMQQIADACGGTVNWAIDLPDGSGAATMSMPLPADHWLTAEHDNVPPMPFRLGTGHPKHDAWKRAIWAAGRYAVRGATMNGKEADFDPDALVQNLVVGLIGYHTPDGTSGDAWGNPDPVPPLFPAPIPAPEVQQTSVNAGSASSVAAAIERVRSLADAYTDLPDWAEERAALYTVCTAASRGQGPPREPDETMLDAARLECNKFKLVFYRSEVKALWHAMFDAAPNSRGQGPGAKS